MDALPLRCASTLVPGFTPLFDHGRNRGSRTSTVYSPGGTSSKDQLWLDRSIFLARCVSNPGAVKKIPASSSRDEAGGSFVLPMSSKPMSKTKNGLLNRTTVM